MPDFTVIRTGTDSSGRGIHMTRYMAAWLERVVADLGFEPVVTQGAFMVRNGGGASASEGYHDAAGCLDFRTWNLTEDQQEMLVRTMRRYGAAAWRRDQRHGMDPHLHIVLGTDVPLASGAMSQWRDYVQGFNGLASRGPDYEWRPNPLVLTPPEDDLNADDKVWLENLIDAKLAANNKMLVTSLLAAAVNRTGDSVKKALRLAAGLGG